MVIILYCRLSLDRLPWKVRVCITINGVALLHPRSISHRRSAFNLPRIRVVIRVLLVRPSSRLSHWLILRVVSLRSILIPMLEQLSSIRVLRLGALSIVSSVLGLMRSCPSGIHNLILELLFNLSTTHASRSFNLLEVSQL